MNTAIRVWEGYDMDTTYPGSNSVAVLVWNRSCASCSQWREIYVMPCMLDVAVSAVLSGEKSM